MPSAYDYTSVMLSKAATVDQYLARLPADRRATLEAVRKVIRANLDPQIEEGMHYGMISYYVPHRVFPEGYHCNPKQPLPFGALAAQKNYFALHLFHLYTGPELAWLQKAWRATGCKLDMGRCCIRFKHLGDVPLEVVGEAVRRVTAQEHIERYQKVMELNQRAAAKRKAKRKTAART
jgi:hypothetical protein